MRPVLRSFPNGEKFLLIDSSSCAKMFNSLSYYNYETFIVEDKVSYQLELLITLL